MSLFEFSDISKSEETIQRTWEDFRSALATGVFSYNELDAAKANTTFLKVFDDLFSHCHPFFDVSAESILSFHLMTYIKWILILHRHMVSSSQENIVLPRP